MTGTPDSVPHALLHNLKHNKVLHERIVLMTVRTEDEPRVAPENRIQIEQLKEGFYRVDPALRLHRGARTFPRR